MTLLFIGLFSGIAFGFVIQRVGATDPDRMGRAHLMLDPDIPRFMLTAVILSAIGLFGLEAVGVGRTMILPLSLVATTIAALLFGVGWGLCGYCPGTTWAAVGEGRIDAIFALLGGMCGAALFAQMHEILIPLLYSPTNIGQLTLADLVGSPTIALLALIVVFSAAIWGIGRFWHEG
nr:YeeE/YedE thiosulfate transporter family protein [uncultured Desulfobulbus sp.]